MASMTRALTAVDVEDFSGHNHDPSVDCHETSFEDVLRSPFHGGQAPTEALGIIRISLLDVRISHVSEYLEKCISM